ncbi:hypothetical protein NC652_037214 [Populus alba x Populus x berolinensis]|nr:hypothetical protein NC652_037214 [Populus alba x Populus x berolinensis]
MEILASSSCLVSPSGGEASELESLELQMHRMEFFVNGWLSSVQTEVERERERERVGEERDVIMAFVHFGPFVGGKRKSRAQTSHSISVPGRRKTPTGPNEGDPEDDAEVIERAESDAEWNLEMWTHVLMQWNKVTKLDLMGSRKNLHRESQTIGLGHLLEFVVYSLFCGAQLLQNIVKSTQLQFPLDNKDLSADCKDLCQKLLRRSPVERLTFEEFFNHPFLSQRKKDESLSRRRSSRSVDGFPFSESNLGRNADDNSQEDCLPFLLDDDSSGLECSPFVSKRMSPMKSTYGFSVDSGVGGRDATSNVLNDVDFTSRYDSARQNLENASFRPGINKALDESLNEPPKYIDHRSAKLRSRVVDSLELIDQDYVLVSGPPLDVSSSTASTSKPSNAQCKSDSPPRAPAYINTTPSVPVPIIGTANKNRCLFGSLEIPSSAPGTSEGSVDLGDALEQPSTHCMTRIKSLQQCASAITELVLEKIKASKLLEAFSIQLVILAIWKQALHICHTQAASAIEGSPSQESSRLRRSSSKKHGTPDTEDCPDVGPENMSAEIEGEFLQEVERAEELSKAIEPGSIVMPDAMETIFQSALYLGRIGGVDELMGDLEKAALLYSKAVRLLVFLLVEAPSLILNPPFSLTNSDRYRLRRYIDILNNRQNHSWPPRMAPPKREDQQCPP